MKRRTNRGLVGRENIQSSFPTTCKPDDNATSHKYLHRTVGQHFAIVVLILISIGLGLGTTTTQAQTRAYLTNPTSNTVSVIDIATNTLVATIPVGGFPEALAITPDGTRVYVTNALDNTVSVIDTATNTVVATISFVTSQDCAQSLCFSPFGVAITPDGTRAYVSNTTFSFTVSVIDIATNTVGATIPSGNAGFPVAVAITPDGTRVYVTTGGAAQGNTVLVIDTATNTVITSIPVAAAGNPITAVAITPDGTSVYVTSLVSDTVSVIDTATNTVVATIPVGGFPMDVAITPDGTRAYVTNSSSDTVSVIDTATNTVVVTIPVGGFGFGCVAITPDGTRAYLANSNSHNTLVIDTATNTVVATISGLDGTGIAFTPAPLAPESKQQCKHGEYLKFGPPAGPFKTQGQCVSYVEHH
jgi:YVTN family beta-propeller protein